jgi:uncharacterized LabA/DUF88 family protein
MSKHDTSFKPQLKKAVTYAFIDSQNLNLGVKSQGWNLDFKKFRIYLKNKYNVTEAYLFIGNVPGNEGLYNRLQSFGYKLVMKPTVEYKKDGKVVYKGNVDAELVLYSAAKLINSYDHCLVVSGDGDFACLFEYLTEMGKLQSILVPNSTYSGLLKPFASFIARIDKMKNSLEYTKNDQHRRSVETLGVSGRGDKKIVARSSKKVNKGDQR